MNGDGRLGRRHLLIGFGAVAATAVSQPWRLVNVVGVPLEGQLASLLPATESAQRVGSAYLRTRPHEADAGILTDLLLQSLGAHRDDPASELAQLAIRAIAAEFQARAVVLVDGWVTAPTEARLAALCTIVDAERRAG